MGTPTTRTRLVQLSRVVGLVVLVGLVVRRLDLGAVAASWRGTTPLVAGLVATAFVTAMTTRIAKWAWQLRQLGIGYDRRLLARNFLLSVLLGAVTPMRAGELYRLAAVRPDPARRAEQLALVGASLLLEKGYEVLVLVGIVAVGAVGTDARLAAGLAFLLLTGLAFGVGSLAPPAALVARLPARVRTWAVEPVLRARDGLSLSGRLGLLGLTAASHGLNLLGGLGVYRAFGPMPAWIFLFRMPLVTLTNILPLSVGGIGVREMAAMEVFGRAGFPPSSAAVAASCLFLGANLLPVLVLLPLASFRREASPEDDVLPSAR